jgi:hypothetical protein
MNGKEQTMNSVPIKAPINMTNPTLENSTQPQDYNSNQTTFIHKPGTKIQRLKKIKEEQNSMPNIYELRNRTPGDKLQPRANQKTIPSAAEQLVATGYLLAAITQQTSGGGPPPSPSSDGSSSDSSSGDSFFLSVTEESDDSSDVHRAKAELKRTRPCKDKSHGFISKVTVPEPKAYFGTKNYDEFEEWLYSVNNYYKLTGLPKHLRVRHIKGYLKGKAASWYMQFVAPQPWKWTMKRVGEALFDHFFPPQLRSELRRRFNNATQGSRNIKEWIQYVTTLASRVPDLTERSIVI